MVLYSVGMYLLVCRCLFGCSRLLSLIASFGQSKLMVDEPRERIIYTIMLLSIYRASIRPCVRLVGYFFWSTWTSLFMSLLVVWVLKKVKMIQPITRITVYLNVSVIQWVCMRLAILTDLLDSLGFAEITTRATSPGANGLLHLILYCALSFSAKWSSQYVCSSVVALFVGDDGLTMGRDVEL